MSGKRMRPMAGDHYARIRIGYWNLREGGLDGDDDQRLQQILDLLAAQQLDVACLGEARWSERGNRAGNRRLHQVADRLSMHGRFLAHSRYYECDMAIFVREDKLRVVEERHECGVPWFHGLGRLETVVDGFGRLDIAVNHLAPSMRLVRAQEAEAFRLLGKVPVIAVGDYNAAAEQDLVDPKRFEPDKEHKLDTTPDRTITAAGFTDAGAAFGDLSPTVGWRDGKAYRCDRVYHNVNGAQITAYTVLAPTPTRPLSLPGRVPRPRRGDLGSQPLPSDHGGVIAEIALPLRTTPTRRPSPSWPLGPPARRGRLSGPGRRRRSRGASP